MNAYEIRSNQVINYMKLHLVSLEQDLEKYTSEDEIGYLETYAAISTTRHLLSVVADILGIELEEN